NGQPVGWAGIPVGGWVFHDDANGHDCDGNWSPCGSATRVANGQNVTLPAHLTNYGQGGFPDGTFVRTPNGNIYRIAGGAPLWISDCAPLGGCPYVSVSDLSQFRSRPLDGTFIATAETGRVYR